MSTKTRKQSGLQPGTATSTQGQEKVAVIIRAARDVICSDGATQFTMRNIAKQAGMYLRNLQYYFPTREDLIRALSEEGGRRYSIIVDKALAKAGDDPIERLMAAVDVYIKDNANNTRQRRYNIQIISLLHALDDYKGHLLDEYYSKQFIHRFEILLKNINPDLTDDESNYRAKMITSLLDGIMLFAGPLDKSNKDLQPYCVRIRSEIYTIAVGTESEISKSKKK